MKTAVSSIILFIYLLGFSVQAEEVKTKTFTLEWDHWLWMARIARQDPGFTPKDFDFADRSIRMVERKSAKDVYEACGIVVVHGESFIYGPVTTQMIARLGSENFRRVRQIHQTIRDWKCGRTSEWHLDWVPRPESKAKTKPSANKTDAGNGSKAISRFSKVLRSPAPDHKRSPQQPSPLCQTIFLH